MLMQHKAQCCSAPKRMMNEIDTYTTPPEIVKVSYEDLIAFDQNYSFHHDAIVLQSQSTSSSSSSSSTTTFKNDPRVDVDSKNLMKRIGYDAFGPHGLGIVLVENVPNFTKYRQALLPLAAQIPNIPNVEETCTDPKSYYQVGWSHGKEILSDHTTGTRQPDIYKGSYYANPFTNDLLQTLVERDGCPTSSPQQQQEQERRRHLDLYTKNKWPPSPYLPELESAFCQMGQLLHHVGCIIAKVCDAHCSGSSNHIGQKNTTTNIATTILKSKNANGRLLHYFPMDTTKTTTTTTTTTELKNDGNNENDPTKTQPQSWCSWHNDHGLITGLVPGMYIDTRTGLDVTEQMQRNNKTSSNGGSSTGGLYIQARNGQCVHVPIPINCCAYQIGETAQIMSGGLLQATPHAVFPPTSSSSNSTSIDDINYISRESFALFLEPEFDDVLVVPTSTNERSINDCCDVINDTTTRLGLRSISERYQIGQTFGDFHLATVSNNATST